MNEKNKLLLSTIRAEAGLRCSQNPEEKVLSPFPDALSSVTKT